MGRKWRILFVWLAFSFACSPAGVIAADWPMWRYDANRSAASPQELPAELHLQWVREYPKLQMAWKDPINQDRMPFDKVYEPVVLGQTMFLGTGSSDKVVALDTRTGRELWRFYTDGPVRFPAVAWQGKVYFTSDDGYLYCVSAKSGALIWKFRGGPSDRKILGNERLISTWPARGGPVIADGTVYFAASIWPFMGVFVHALEAESGKVIWTSDGTGATYMYQPHNSPAFGGVAPQGSLVVMGDKLLVPGGRSVPACFDRRTGKMLYYRLADNGKRGGSHVSAIGQHFFNHRSLGVFNLYDLETGDLLIGDIGNIPVLTEDGYYFGGSRIVALDPKSFTGYDYEVIVRNRKTLELERVTRTKWLIGYLWEFPVDASGALIKAGSHLYAGGGDIVSAVDIPAPGGKPEMAWTATIEGTAARIIAAADRLFVVTLEGRIYCFGGEPKAARAFHPYSQTPPPPPDATTARAKAILERTGVREGYCLAYGVTTGRLVEELARYSDLRIIGFCPDAEKLEALRRQLDAAGLYGSRIALHTGDPLSVEIAPYLASLTVFEDPGAVSSNVGKAFVKKLFYTMRPYGGVACLPLSGELKSRFTTLVSTSGLPGARLQEDGDFVLLWREGPLVGADSWTHQYGDIANTVKSDDKLVKAPLGLLWFGGSSHMDVLPRHGHGPPEQVIGGRLFIRGINSLSARDVYTGRVLWKRKFPALTAFDIYYDETYRANPLDTSYNQQHLAGANVRGADFVVTLDRVYIIHGERCLVLGPATGATIKEFQLPIPPGATEPPEWGYIGVYQDLLIAGAKLAKYPSYYQPVEPHKWQNFERASSRRLVVMDRYSGEVLWSFDSHFGIRHNTIAVGNDKLFCIDMAPGHISALLQKVHGESAHRPRLLALDVRSGKPLWSTTANVFGTWLGYSEEHDILLVAGRRSRDMLDFEPDHRMITYRGRDGKVLWDKQHDYNGPCILHGKTIITQGHELSRRQAFSLLTGEPVMRTHPLTGEKIPWRFKRHYGCDVATASEYLVLFRSAAAGFFDLETGGGTGNLGGFKSGCTSNLVAADGVLNAPDYTRTCTCSYQNQTSLAMVHMPDNEIWTLSDLKSLVPNPLKPLETEMPRIKRVGINLGAPGDRLAENGVLWLDYPSVGGSSPDIPVTVTPAEPTWFRHHSSWVAGKAGLKWIAASGAEGLTSVTITLADESARVRPYTVRLHFAEPEDIGPGERVFSVALQARTVLRDLDIVRETGRPRRALVKEFKDVRIGARLKIFLTPSSKPATSSVESGKSPVLSGIEVVGED